MFKDIDVEWLYNYALGDKYIKHKMYNKRIDMKIDFYDNENI